MYESGRDHYTFHSPALNDATSWEHSPFFHDFLKYYDDNAFNGNADYEMNKLVFISIVY